MSSQHLADILLHHKRLLWWMTDRARFAFLAELREDYLFEEQMQAVAAEMMGVA